jgi:hypothetical protein
MSRDEKSLLKRQKHLEEKLASLPEIQERSITQKRLATLWQHQLNRTKKMLLAVRDGKEARLWVDYPLESKAPRKRHRTEIA